MNEETTLNCEEMEFMAWRMEDPFKGIEFVEIELAGIPEWEKANVRKIEGMLKGFYQSAPVALQRRLHAVELFYSSNLTVSHDICQKQLSTLSELKKLSANILKLMDASRYLMHHFQRDRCLVLGFHVEIQERSLIANRLLRQLREELVREEDLLPDPTLDPRIWRAKGTKPKAWFFYNNGGSAERGRQFTVCPGNGKRLSHNRRMPVVIELDRAMTNEYKRKKEDPSHLPRYLSKEDVSTFGYGKKGKRYSAARKNRERDRLDLLRAA